MNRTGSILLVEDSEDDIFFVKRAFKAAHIQQTLEVFMDGEAVVNRLEKSRSGATPLLMLLDLKLPRKDGFEVLEWVRKHPLFSNLVIVVFTSSLEVGDVNRAYSLGANAYLGKVGDKETLERIAKGLKDFWLGLNHPPVFR